MLHGMIWESYIDDIPIWQVHTIHKTFCLKRNKIIQFYNTSFAEREFSVIKINCKKYLVEKKTLW
jgi:hypothetical protein